MPAVRNRTLKAFAGALVAAALVVAPVVTAGASAKENDKEPAAASAVWPADTVGVKGELVEWTSDSNKADYWEDYTDHKATCYEGGGAHGAVTGNGWSVTLEDFNPAWKPADHWELLVIKAGNEWNSVIEHPEANKAYASPPKGKNQAKVSHWIVCKGITPDEPQLEVVTPTLDYDEPTCLVEGSVIPSDNAKWTSKENGDGTTTWTAAPLDGTKFDEGAVIHWVVKTDLGKLTEACDSEEPQQPDPLMTVVPKTVVDCSSTTANVTTTTTIIPYVWNAGSEKWELGSPVTKHSITARPLTEEELADCPLLPGEITSVCVGDVPYLGYEVSLPEGYEADSENPVTITFVNPDGENYVVEDQPLSGALLWPGASNAEPKMWPGWELVNGEYVKTTGNFDWTRNGITVRFDVNPTYETEVEYPAATALCANPPVGGGDDPTGTPASSDAETLPATGGGISPMFVVAGGAALVAGIAAVAFAAYRRRQADMK
ncbi:MULTISPECIES: LPXTG cell wall anchor domain-containing protein [Microbacterium]|uniref:LPXTG cell wall anchor domain-containing protein n=1 Tax=Microbacterium TaxID=33882 RepID=UPI0013A53DA4|nr:MULTISPECIES: LPXTG cell wall anchor domain-containing protein [Microbacterium]